MGCVRQELAEGIMGNAKLTLDIGSGYDSCSTHLSSHLPGGSRAMLLLRTTSQLAKGSALDIPSAPRNGRTHPMRQVPC
jgi:hypothetical protein